MTTREEQIDFIQRVIRYDSRTIELLEIRYAENAHIINSISNEDSYSLSNRLIFSQIRIESHIIDIRVRINRNRERIEALLANARVPEFRELDYQVFQPPRQAPQPQTQPRQQPQQQPQQKQPTIISRALKRADAIKTSKDCCAICTNDHIMSETCQADCGHFFGGECYKKWMDSCVTQQKKTTCPICRKSNKKVVMFRPRKTRELKPKI